MIQGLIDKQDTFEIVRDQVAAILTTEVANQQVLAIADGQDPSYWKLRIFTERANPWEQILNTQNDTSPIINIWYDNSSFDTKASNAMERQAAEAVFNIDCYAYGGSANNAGGGHTPGDEAAALEVQKACRLVRNILMASEYTYLGLQGTVWGRWPQSISVFQPQIGNETIQNIIGARFVLRVKFNEFAPQYEGTTLDYVAISVHRDEIGELSTEAIEMGGDLEMNGALEMRGQTLLYLQADYDYAAPDTLEMDGDLEMDGEQEMYGED